LQYLHVLFPCQQHGIRGFLWWGAGRERGVQFQGFTAFKKRRRVTAEPPQSVCAPVSRCPCGVSGSAVRVASQKGSDSRPGAGWRPARKHKGCSWPGLGTQSQQRGCWGPRRCPTASAHAASPARAPAARQTPLCRGTGVKNLPVFQRGKRIRKKKRAALGKPCQHNLVCLPPQSKQTAN